MVVFNPERFLGITSALMRLESLDLMTPRPTWVEEVPGKPSTQTGSAALMNVVSEAKRQCENLGLVMSAAAFERLIQHLPDLSLCPDQTTRLCEAARNTLQDELRTKTLLMLSPVQADYYWAFTEEAGRKSSMPIEISWSPVFASFPSTKWDALESLRAYALERHTSCVFHLMRVLELGLTALGAMFGVSLAHKNWEPAISEIEKKIRDIRNDPNWSTKPTHKEDLEFYAQAASHFRVLKDAWRNYTAHARGRYDEPECMEMLINVRGFMQKISERLHE